MDKLNYDILSKTEIKKYEKMAFRAIRNGRKSGVYEFNGNKTTLNALCDVLDNLDYHYSKKMKNPIGTGIMPGKLQQNDAPVAVVKNPTPNMAEKTEPDTSKTAKTNVKKVLHKNRTKTIDKTKKNNYITNTIAGQSRKTKTTTNKRSTMTNNNLTKNSLTKKQLAAFETVYHHIWRTISNTIPMNNKKMRSAGFEQARIETIKLLKKIY